MRGATCVHRPGKSAGSSFRRCSDQRVVVATNVANKRVARAKAFGGEPCTPPEAQLDHPVLGPGEFAAVLTMVMLTTVLTPPLLRWRLGHEATALAETA